MSSRSQIATPHAPSRIERVTTCFTPPGPFHTPVLFLVFNRPDATARVFEAIRLAKPPRLYVAADGPRANRPDEAAKVTAVRTIATNVDWPCEVKILFREENLGCKIAVSSALDWFFANEEMGIVLEDDCLPSQSFFWFCEVMLQKYRDDKRVGQVCGFNILNDFSELAESYVFSKFGPIWGWATWQRAWANYDVNMSLWPTVKNSANLQNLFDTKVESRWSINVYDAVYAGGIDTWDYQWSFAKQINNQLSIIPVINLINNIGFGHDATHTVHRLDQKYQKSYELTPIADPCIMVRNKYFDREFCRFAGMNRVNNFKAALKYLLGCGR